MSAIMMSLEKSKKQAETTSRSVEAEKRFIEAYDEFGEGIFRYIAMKISDRDMARDLMQEAFTRAWDYCVKGGEILEWKPFLYRTAYNLVVDTYRKKRSVSLDAMIEDTGFAIPDEDDVRSVNRAEAARIRIAIDLLDETYRDVVLLRFTEDMPPREIARMLGLTENVVSVRLHRGIKLLRTHMETKRI